MPDRLLDDQAGNGWIHDPGRSAPTEGGMFSKQATNAYRDDAEDGRGYQGFLTLLSVRGMLSPDREELREDLKQALREDVQSKGLELGTQLDEGERTLATGARSFYLVFNATARGESQFFSDEATIKVIGEVFRCTGDATVVVTGQAQIDERRSTNIGGIQTERNVDPRTWAEIVRDPSGTVDGHSGSSGLIYNIEC